MSGWSLSNHHSVRQTSVEQEYSHGCRRLGLEVGDSRYKEGRVFVRDGYSECGWYENEASAVRNGDLEAVGTKMGLLPYGMVLEEVVGTKKGRFPYGMAILI